MPRRAVLRYVLLSFPLITNQTAKLRKRESLRQAVELNVMKNHRDRGVFGLMKIVLVSLLLEPWEIFMDTKLASAVTQKSKFGILM
jgi:hypothetical protein